MSKIKELRKLKKEELETRLDQLRMELIKINAQISTGTPPENPGLIMKLSRERYIFILIRKINLLKQQRLDEEQNLNAHFVIKI